MSHTSSALADSGHPEHSDVQKDDSEEVIQITGQKLKEVGPVQQDVTAEDIAQQAGAGNDAMRALASTPAVSRLPFSFGGIALRGASIRNTSVYIDGTPVPLPFHFGGVTSIFPSYALSELTLSPGNFSAEFGRATGGVVVIHARMPKIDRYRVGMDTSILHASAWAEGPLAPAKNENPWGFLVGARRSFLDLVLAPFVDEDTPLPAYTDAQLVLSSGAARSWGQLRPTFFYSKDQTENSDLALSLGFWRASLPWKYFSRGKLFELSPWIGRNNVDFTGDMTPDDRVVKLDVKRQTAEWGARGHFAHFTAHVETRAGFDIASGNLTGTTANQGETLSTKLQPQSWLHLGAWTSVAMLGNWGSVVPAMRIDRVGLSDETLLSPRLNVNILVGPSFELRAAAGRFVEPPLAADLGSAPTGATIQSSSAMQYSLGLQKFLGNGLSAELTGYMHRSKNLPVISQYDVFQTVSRNSFSPLVLEIVQQYLGEGTPRQSIGEGRAYGLESLLRFATGNHRLQLAYTWSRSKRTEQPAYFVGYHPYVLDQQHRVHALWQYQRKQWKWGAGFHFATGIPYSPIVIVEDDGVEEGVGGDGRVRQALWGQRVPNFLQLDVRVERTWRSRRGEWGAYLDVQNVTARSNVESIREVVTYDGWVQPQVERTSINGLPFVPIFGVKFTPD